MTKTPDPTTVPIQDLTKPQLHRLLAADYLESIAGMIRNGSVQGFELAWDARYEKPVGAVTVDSHALKGPLELRIISQIQKAEAEATAIDVEDISERLKDHSCEDDSCMACRDPIKEN